MFDSELKTLSSDLSKEADGIVIYTDGSHSSNFNLTGGGIHGYTYKKEKPKRGLGLGKWKATPKGYSAEATEDELVTVVDYFDGILSLAVGTNNTAELKTGVAGLELVSEASDNGIKNANILMDSRYVIDGIEKHIDKWVANDWLKPNGAPLLNTEVWKSAYETKNKLKENKVEYTIEWIKGHTGNPGNETADVNSKIGRVLNPYDSSVTQEVSGTFTRSDPQGYWKVDTSDKVSVLAGTSLIFDVRSVSDKATRFFAFTNGDSDSSMYGIHDNTACYGVVELKESPSLINSIMQRQKTVCKNSDPDISLFYQLHMRNAFSPKTLSNVKKYGTKVLTSSTKYKELKLLGDGSTITEILYPVRFAVDGVMLHQSLSEILDGFLKDKLESSDVFNVIDITDHVYLMVEEGKKKVCKIREELNSSNSSLDLSEHYPDIKTDYGFNPLLLSFGSDLPRREIVAGAAKLEPKAYIIHWEDSGSFKRSFVLETTEGTSIWHNPWRSVL